MLRWLIYLLGSIFVLALVRGVIGIVTKGVAQLFEEEAQQQAGGGSARKPSDPGKFGGELIKCPSCGVFFPPAKGVKKSLQGSTLSFCSENCRAKLA